MIALYHKRAENAMYGRHIGVKSFFIRKMHQYYAHMSNTNGADTAMRLAEAKIRTVCTGGELLSESMAYVGSAAIDTVRKVYFDAVLFSSAGFDDNVVSD